MYFPFIYAYWYINEDLCINIYIYNIYVHKNIYLDICVHVHMSVCMCMYVSMYVSLYTYMYA